MSAFKFLRPEHNDSMPTSRESSGSSSSESSTAGLLATYSEKVDVEDLTTKASQTRRCHSSCPAFSSRPLRVAILTVLVCLALTFAVWPATMSSVARSGGAALSKSAGYVTYATPPVGIQLQDLDPALLPHPAGPNYESERRLLIVGRVNGRLDELNALLKEVNFSNTSDTLLLTGDFLPTPPRPRSSIAEYLFTKHPQSAGSTLAAINALHAKSVLGPHEAHLLSHAGVSSYSSPLPPASASTLHDPNKPIANYPPQPSAATVAIHADPDIYTLQNLPLILRLGRLSGPTSPITILAHAGLVPGLPLDSQTASDVFALGTGSGFIRQIYGADDIGVPHMEGWRVAGPDEEGWTGSRPWWDVWGEVQEEVGAVGLGMGVLEMSEVSAGVGESVGAAVGAGVALGERGNATVRVVYGGVGGGTETMRREVRREKWSVGLGGGCGESEKRGKLEKGDDDEGLGRGDKLTGLLINGDGREEVVQVFCEARA